ncbi:heavy-metal-associated domain-containing protein [Candidatus Peregrinibacteria bacterium]|nr:heavy-metal-associated domain-containing protein [Candidatus Peregrinibacteria bacterium]
MQTIVSIPGMHCASCAALIHDISSEFLAIKKTDIDIESKRVTLEHDESFNFDAWKQEVEASGDEYTVHPVTA